MKIVKRGKRDVVSRLTHSKNDKEMVATLGSDLDRALHAVIYNNRSRASSNVTSVNALAKTTNVVVCTRCVRIYPATTTP